jgi:hypothetical protein
MKIYKIIADLPDGRFMVYIGSTINELSKRLKAHKKSLKDYKSGKKNYMTSFQLIQQSWFEITLVEDLGFCSKQFMLDKEAYYINYYKNLSDDYLVVNKMNPNCIDKKKISERKKLYYEINKDKIRQSKKIK